MALAWGWGWLSEAPILDKATVAIPAGHESQGHCNQPPAIPARRSSHRLSLEKTPRVCQRPTLDGSSWPVHEEGAGEALDGSHGSSDTEPEGP